MIMMVMVTMITKIMTVVRMIMIMMIITIRFDDVINDDDSSNIDNDVDDDSIGN